MLFFDKWCLYYIYYIVIYCRFNFFSGCPHAHTCTIIMRGGAEQFIEETERSLHDAIMIVRRAIKNDSVVAGIPFYLYSFIYCFYLLIWIINYG